MVRIGIIGGSGLESLNILQAMEEKEAITPYGRPSSTLKIGRIKGVEVVLLARHGQQHTIPPSQVNFRANIFALKEAGCTHIIATTAVGSLREQIGRGDLVILDQFIDFTGQRKFSFFEEFEPDQPKHTPMAEPFSAELRTILLKGCEELNLRYHPTGTVVTIEGPRFSTKAESHMFRQWGADVINMTIATECALANEAGIPYGAVAMSTDYDCWKEDEEPVSWEAVMKIFKTNAINVTNLLLSVIDKMQNKSDDKMIKEKIRTVPNWPKPGIMFRDITTLLKDAVGWQKTIDLLAERYKDFDFDLVVGIESRGFILGSALAYKLGKGFVPARKKGKLPAETVSQEYALEYGLDQVEIHQDAIKSGQKVLLADDLIATGGTALASCNLIKQLGGEVVECCFVIDLPDLGGRQKLIANGYKVFNLVEFAGE